MNHRLDLSHPAILRAGFLSRSVLLLIATFLLCFETPVWAGTTGKLAGRIISSTDGEPLIGANVALQGTYLGAAADADGYYAVTNIPPGEYVVLVSMVGYHRKEVRKVIIQIDLTTKLDIELVPAVLEVDVVIVEAERPMIQKDLTSTSAIVSSQDIKMMPVENLSQVVNLQAGVMDGHFRGGRRNEVAYLVDGLSVNDAFNNSRALEIENSSIRQMEVISGTFNAEYGQAMSGVVNIVTQDGSDRLEAQAAGYVGGYFTSHDDTFKNLDEPRASIKDLQLTLSGPIPITDGLRFFGTGRYLKDDGYLYGIRVYNITDDVPYFPIQGDNTVWIPRNTGDGAFVPMNPAERISLNGKVSLSLPSLKLSYSIFYDQNKNKYYDHYFSWTPDGILNHFRNDWVQNVQVTHVLSSSTFQTFKAAMNYHEYEGYLYEDPFDSRYVDPRRGLAISNYTFRSGGNDGSRYRRSTRTMLGQWALSSQVVRQHKIGVGVEARFYEIMNHGWEIYNQTEGQIDVDGNPIFTLGYRQVGTFGNQMYTKYPFDVSAYIQDKMEYDIMIINAGLRFDYFRPNGSYPADLRNPTGNPDFPGANEFVEASPKLQISPRLGLSFPISDAGAIHFSYGHFFQIPDFQNLYFNSDYLVQPGASLSSITGNPDLEPQRTVMYEIGLQQVLVENLAVDFTLYYRDIRNLLGMEIINTYEGFKYARFINRDYGNVRGVIVSFDKRFANYFSVQLDYTFQIAEGNASDPYAVYNDNQTDPPVESEKKVVPLDWDQRSTLNLVVNVGEPEDWTVGIVFQMGSGTPYTEDPRLSQGVRFENGGSKPSVYNLDLRANKVFTIGDMRLNAYLLIYNLLDIKNEYNVYATTGRATYDLNVKYAGDIIGLNTYDQYVNNPALYSSPRQIRLGVGVGF